jgi:hypothetical protein
VAALAEVVGAGVADDGALVGISCARGECSGREGEKTYADDALGANQLDELVLDAALGVALAIGLDVAQVADVALLVAGGAVGLVVGVDWVGGSASCRRGVGAGGKLTVGTSRGAAVGVVAKGVDVHATLSVGVVARDVPGDGRLRVLVGLLKGDGSLDVRVSANDSDWRQLAWVLVACQPYPLPACARPGTVVEAIRVLRRRRGSCIGPFTGCLRTATGRRGHNVLNSAQRLPHLCPKWLQLCRDGDDSPALTILAVI